MLDPADNKLIMDDQPQRSFDRTGAGRPIEHLIRPGIPGELTFMQPELVDLLTVGNPAFSARAARRAACGLPTTADPPRPGS